MIRPQPRSAMPGTRRLDAGEAAAEVDGHLAIPSGRATCAIGASASHLSRLVLLSALPQHRRGLEAKGP
jgi:hypothetical protein